ncbi:3'-5' exonuclease [Pontibacter liquoris]|uniref:3'-5' exonuclease n=1 Tax=Pontibacter liquoris TaxID=2905677 RepID=UPI001FA7A09C|nr:3'-5' exonuclease [Pontibacter liquoris]
MINIIDHELKPSETIILTGCPGSGKTTVATHRAKILTETNSNSKFRYFIYPVLLKQYLTNVLKKEKIPESRVTSIMAWYYGNYRKFLLKDNRVNENEVVRHFSGTGMTYDNIIVDEAQDIWPEVLRNFPLISKRITFICDHAQEIMGNFSSKNGNIRDLLKTDIERAGYSVLVRHLATNFRNPESVYRFAKEFVRDMPTSDIERFNKAGGEPPLMIVMKDPNRFQQILINQVRNNSGINIGILCTYASDVRKVSSILKRDGIEHTPYYNGIPDEEKKSSLENIKNVVVTTFKSSKGLEFQLVIMPFVENYKGDAETRREYYVGCTRAEERLILLATGKPAEIINTIPRGTYVLKEI